MFELLRAANGFFWRLKAANGETLCHSEVYTTKQSALVGIESVRRTAPGAGFKDLT